MDDDRTAQTQMLVTPPAPVRTSDAAVVRDVSDLASLEDLEAAIMHPELSELVRFALLESTQDSPSAVDSPPIAPRRRSKPASPTSRAPGTACASASASTSAPKRPSGRRTISPEERANRRRKQHRELVARGRARVRERLQQLKTEESTLQRALDQLIARLERRPMLRDLDDHHDSARPLTQQRFAHAVFVQEALRRENAQMENRIEHHLRFQDAVYVASMEAEEDDDDQATDRTRPKAQWPPPPPQQHELLHRRGYWTFFGKDDEPFYFEPYTPEQCDRMMGATYRESQRLEAAFAQHLFPTMVVHCFGWRVQRLLHPRHILRFHINKLVPTADSHALAEELVGHTWRILNTPELYAQLYRTKIVVQVLQRLGDHTSVIIRSMPNRLHSLSFRCFNMMRLLRHVDDQGRPVTSILVHVLTPQCPEDAARQAQRGIQFVQAGFTYISFLEREDETLEITYAGTGDCPNEDYATDLLMELGCVWFRWEQAVLPKRLVTVD